MHYEANRKNLSNSQNIYSMDYGSENTLHSLYFKLLEEIRVYDKSMKQKNIDNSRIDSMIAVRMRATGHNQASIEQAIKDCAREWREPNERKSWDDYARRTAEYAFSYTGDLDMLRNEQQHKQWFSVEGKIQNTSKMNTEYRRLKT